jgi:hypothetical protein
MAGFDASIRRSALLSLPGERMEDVDFRSAARVLHQRDELTAR